MDAPETHEEIIQEEDGRCSGAGAEAVQKLSEVIAGACEGVPEEAIVVADSGEVERSPLSRTAEEAIAAHEEAPKKKRRKKKAKKRDDQADSDEDLLGDDDGTGSGVGVAPPRPVTTPPAKKTRPPPGAGGENPSF